MDIKDIATALQHAANSSDPSKHDGAGISSKDQDAMRIAYQLLKALASGFGKVIKENEKK